MNGGGDGKALVDLTESSKESELFRNEEWEGRRGWGSKSTAVECEEESKTSDLKRKSDRGS